MLKLALVILLVPVLGILTFAALSKANPYIRMFKKEIAISLVALILFTAYVSNTQ